VLAAIIRYFAGIEVCRSTCCPGVGRTGLPDPDHRRRRDEARHVPELRGRSEGRPGAQRHRADATAGTAGACGARPAAAADPGRASARLGSGAHRCRVRDGAAPTAAAARAATRAGRATGRPAAAHCENARAAAARVLVGRHPTDRRRPAASAPAEPAEPAARLNQPNQNGASQLPSPSRPRRLGRVRPLRSRHDQQPRGRGAQRVLGADGEHPGIHPRYRPASNEAWVQTRTPKKSARTTSDLVHPERNDHR